MKTLYKVTLLNFDSIIGCVITVILVAPKLSLWMCVALCLETLVVMNTGFSWRLSRIRKIRDVEGSLPKSTVTRNPIVAVAAFLLTLVIAWMESHWWKN